MKRVGKLVTTQPRSERAPVLSKKLPKVKRNKPKSVSHRSYE